MTKSRRVRPPTLQTSGLPPEFLAGQPREVPAAQGCVRVVGIDHVEQLDVLIGHPRVRVTDKTRFHPRDAMRALVLGLLLGIVTRDRVRATNGRISGQAVPPKAHPSDLYLTALGIVYMSGLLFRPAKEHAQLGSTASPSLPCTSSVPPGWPSCPPHQPHLPHRPRQKVVDSRDHRAVWDATVTTVAAGRATNRGTGGVAHGVGGEAADEGRYPVPGRVHGPHRQAALRRGVPHPRRGRPGRRRRETQGQRQLCSTPPPGRSPSPSTSSRAGGPTCTTSSSPPRPRTAATSTRTSCPTSALNHPGFGGDSGYWIPTRAGSVLSGA